LRELPEPLLTFDEYDNFLKLYGVDNRNDKIQLLSLAFKNVPIHNRYLLYYLFVLIKKIAENKNENLMGIDNLGNLIILI
jgi:hypothetical protein